VHNVGRHLYNLGRCLFIASHLANDRPVNEAVVVGRFDELAPHLYVEGALLDKQA